MTTELTTAESFRQFYPKADQFGDAQITNMVATVNAEVERVCCRTFGEATYRTWVSGRGTQDVIPPEYPVSRLYRVALSKQIGIKDLVCGDTEASQASVSVQDGTLVLVIVGGTHDGVQELTLSDYSSMAALLTAVQGLDGTWTGAVENEGAPQDVRPMASCPCLDSEGEEAALEIPDQSMHVWLDRDVIRSSFVFTEGHQNVFLHYKAGYSTVPKDLRMLVNQILRDALVGADQGGNMQSERLGQYSYSTTGSVHSAVTTYAAELAGWKNVRR